jgi:methyltransferase (TIGR00027 family)
METDRPDAVFRDPYARKLVGDRGEQIVKKMRWGKAYAWPMIVRTAVMDEIIVRLVKQQGVDTVLNLAAGLDARPYRLDLPSSLHWIEADLPDMIRYKEEILAADRPKCRLDRISADLRDAAARRQVLDRVQAGAKNALVITEGLLAYLSPEDVEALARDLHDHPAIRWWLTDIASPKILQRVQKHVGKQLQNAEAIMKFAPPEGPQWFEPRGWKEAEFREMMQEAIRLQRTPKGMWVWAIIKFLFPKKFARDMKAFRSGMLLMQPA